MTPDRFVTDSSLDFVARRLRFLGYDVTTLRGARLEELFDRAGRDGAIVLSRSARHPRRWGAIPLVVLDGADPAAAVRGVASRYTAVGAPFSRCPACNVGLRARHPIEARGEIPGRVLRTVRTVSGCPHCGKWYWDGTHVARIRAWLERALGRALDAPASAGSRDTAPRTESSGDEPARGSPS
jgi:uncharacterized protein with PIN domain